MTHTLLHLLLTLRSPTSFKVIPQISFVAVFGYTLKPHTNVTDLYWRNINILESNVRFLTTAQACPAV